MRYAWKSMALLVVLGLMVPLLGCGGPTEIVVKGTVTFEGEPVETGEILFIPTNGEGPVGAGPITNGEFSFIAPPGEKKVEITANKISDKPAPDGLPNYVPYIPKKYNTATTLTANVENKPENTYAFDLKK
ncbi:hypothetical protein C5Y96_24575 [Blastopirellula marina]|uniref:Carboxypeptidase regulatory-like domain-containing protein n=1 Tax=Blastopirellula marina TaxID=124 RepID=A0A2S8F047_9BACT|nr:MULTISPECIES: hypothetical protein [Pirellulaceae]PQO25517.1 hypothetical protein C5Y96_24575 [Blastopirellula marina]RCS42481.1 hypothetical protein DTL36_24625 [Bremerella cremea]